MLFSNILLAAAALASSALAAGTLQFTTLPSAIVAGKPTTLTWSGGDGSPVIITLMEGPARNLKPVAVVEGAAKGNSFVWTPSVSLPDAKDYALSIQQSNAQGPINYTGLLTLTGGASPIVTVYSSTTGTAPPATSSPSTSTHSTPTPPYTTTYAASSSGTMISMSRNTTFVSATISSTGGGISAGTVTATSTASLTPTGSAPAATTTGSSAAVAVNAGLGSSVVALVGVFAAFVVWA